VQDDEISIRIERRPHLRYADPPLDGRRQDPDVHVDRLVEELARRIDRDPVARLTDQLGHRLSHQLALQVPQRQLEAAQRLNGQAGVTDPSPGPHAEFAGERVDRHELAAEDERRVDVVDERQVHLGERAAVAVTDLTPADDPLGLDPHEAEVHLLPEHVRQRRRHDLDRLDLRHRGPLFDMSGPLPEILGRCATS
jgi:hypothetical protein